jgi:hypothetical protein
MIIMLLPVIIFIFLMGWSMYWIGDQKRPAKRQRKPLKKEKDNVKDNVTIMPIVYEEPQEIAN